MEEIFLRISSTMIVQPGVKSSLEKNIFLRISSTNIRTSSIPGAGTNKSAIL